MKTRSRIPVNTVDRAIQLARVLSRDLGSKETQTRRRYRIFLALTTNEGEAKAAFLIWRAQGAIIRELIHQS